MEKQIDSFLNHVVRIETQSISSKVRTRVIGVIVLPINIDTATHKK